MRKILVIGILLFITTKIYSQWVWQNPFPTGNNINDIKFYNSNIGWFIGNNGTIFKTTNGGKKWIEQSCSPQYNYQSIFPMNEENLWITAFGFSDNENVLNGPTFKILKSNNGGVSWEEVLSGSDLNDSINFKNYRLNDIIFINYTKGFAVGDSGFGNRGVILKTTNGGLNWYVIENPGTYGLKSIQFINDSVGYIVGGQFHVATCDYPPACPSYSNGVILKTTNGGTDWQIVSSDTIMIWDMYFRNEMLGWAVGTSAWDIDLISYEADFILKTTNGGQSWYKKKIEGSIFYLELTSIYFVNDYYGWAVGLGGVVLNTHDGGENWNVNYHIQRFTKYLMDIYFTDALNGYAVGTEGVIIQTTDGGLNWSHYDSKFVNGIINDIHFVNPDTGWFVRLMGEENLYKTTDGGDNWVPQNVSGIYAIDFADDKNGWAVGYGGKITYTSDAGNIWQEQNSGVSVWLRDVKFVNSKTGWAVGEETILKTTNGGNLWFIQRTAPSIATYYQIIWLDSLKIWVYGYREQVQTTDGGTSWIVRSDTSILDKPPKEAKGGSWYYTNNDTGWELKSSSYVSKTTDSGHTWNIDLATDVIHSLIRIHFIDSRHGWTTTMSGGIIRYGYPEKLTSVHDNQNLLNYPINYHLSQNYPNPFNVNTIINYELKIRGYVTLIIYDLLGREVRVLENNSQKSENSYKIIWDGKDNYGRIVASGIYLCRLSLKSIPYKEVNLYSQIIKISFIK